MIKGSTEWYKSASLKLNEFCLVSFEFRRKSRIERMWKYMEKWLKEERTFKRLNYER